MKLLQTQVYTDSKTKEKLELNPTKTIIELVQNSQFFSFKSSSRVVIIAAYDLGQAMSIAKSINLGPCIIQALDQKDGCTLYIQQYLNCKKRAA